MLDFDTFSRSVSKQLRKPLQLVTEVVNSRQNKERFHEKYCSIVIDLMDFYNNEKSLIDLPENVICEKEGLYVISQLKKNKINLNFLGSYLNGIMTNGNLLHYFSPAQHKFYAKDFDDLKAQITKLASNKYASSRVADNVKALNSYYADYFGWGANQISPTKIKIQIGHRGSSTLFQLVIDLFNKRRAVLPKRDIFNYANNLYDLIKQLNYDLDTRKSQREIRRGNASQADIRACTIYKDSKVLVLEPKKLINGPQDQEGLRRAAEMSHTYFGINRTSLITGNTVPGSNWCTAVSADYTNSSQPGSMFFIKRYLYQDGNNLYYFVDLQRDKIYALRTAGANPDAQERYKDLTDYFKYQDLRTYANEEEREKRLLTRTMALFTQEVTSSAGASLGTALNLFQMFDLSIEWAQKHIKFIEAPTSQSTQYDEEELDDLV